MEIRPSQITFASLWETTKDATIFHNFGVHQFEMKTTKKDLCDPCSIGERTYRPPISEQRTEHLNDDIDYCKQITDNPQVWDATETEAITGQFQNILCAAHRMKAPSNFRASHPGSRYPNPNSFSNVQVDSAAAPVDIIRNQIANIRSEVLTKNDNQNIELLTITSGENTLIRNETTSQSLLCKEPDSSLLTVITDHKRMQNKQRDKHYIKQRRKERGWNTKSPKLKQPQRLEMPLSFQHVTPHWIKKRLNPFRQLFRNQQQKVHSIEIMPPPKIKAYKGEQVNAYRITFDQHGVSLVERDDSGNQIRFCKPQEELYKKSTISYKCLLCSRKNDQRERYYLTCLNTLSKKTTQLGTTGLNRHWKQNYRT